VLTRQHAHRRPTGKEVLHHLPGHITGEGRHPTGGQPVVGGTHQHLGLLQLRRIGAQNAGQAQGQRFDLPEGA